MLTVTVVVSMEINKRLSEKSMSNCACGLNA